MVPGVAVGAQRQLVGTAAPRGCADSGSAPPVTELLQGPLLTHLLPPRPGPPGERPLETAQPSGAQPPSAPRVSLSIVSCLKRATPRPHRPGPGEFSCGVSVGHPSVLSPRTDTSWSLDGDSAPPTGSPHGPWAWCPVGARPPLLLVPD